MNIVHMMDQIDKRILNLLQENDKLSYHQIAKKLRMSASTVHTRVKKMKQKGIIKSFSAIIEPEKVGYKSIALISLTVNANKMREIAIKLTSYKEVQIVSTSTGDHDLIALVVARDEKDLWRFVNQKIKTIDGINGRIDVSNFLDVYKFNYGIKLPIDS
jgi:Lrp/AsnC family transcriptional regulator for asnA, asnC and gidA